MIGFRFPESMYPRYTERNGIRMIKKINPLRTASSLLLALLLVFSAVSLTACGDDPAGPAVPSDTAQSGTVQSDEPTSAPETDIRKIADTLLADCDFSGELYQNDKYLTKQFPQLADAFSECAAYVPAEIVPEEIFVFRTNSAEDAGKISEALKTYAKKQADDYASYAAEQVPKLDDYVLYTRGEIVVYVVSCDNAAALSAVKRIVG